MRPVACAFVLSAALAGNLMPAAPAQAQTSNLGGGLIEFLATGQAGGGARYAPQPTPSGVPMPHATPSYYPSATGPSYYAAPHPAPRVVAPAIVPAPQRYHRQPAYATDLDAIPDVSQPEPARPIRRGRSGDVAYAPMPRVSGFDSRFEKQMVDYDGGHGAGTIIIDTNTKYLYLVQGGGRALRYGIGVGRPGFEWAGTKRVTRKAEWPSWTPPREMLKRRPDLPRFMAGGEDNPLGARALYLGSSLYRIHGTNEPSTIGQAVSSGCIRMRNSDVIDLYNRVRVGTKVIVI